ncbi:MAG TPA: thioesterase family protein [Actinomycetota bacterium]|nr:thioesterase family protein [Actinomycetota bacterium]
MTTFSDGVALTRTDTDVFEGAVHPGWQVVRGPHGGYVAALVLNALTERLDDPERAIRSFTTHFIAVPQEGPVTVRTSVERSGRSMSFLSARLEQEGGILALSLAAFSTPWEGFEFDDTTMPDVPPPDDAMPVPDDAPGIPPFLKNLDMRFCIGNPPLHIGADEALLGGWFRLREPQVVDALVTAMLLDAWAPPVFPRSDVPIVCPTIDLTMHFRSPLPLDGAKPDDFYLGRFSSTLSRDGFVEEDGVMWAPDGTVVAQSRQLSLVFFPKKRADAS